MPKKLEITPKIANYLALATDNSVNPNDVSIYETISINTLPVTKSGLFNGARHTKKTLQDMALVANTPANHVPVHQLHDQGLELPVGKTIYAEVNDIGKESELRSLFYLLNSNADLVAKVDNDIISEMSVGVRYKALNCSQCGFDFMGSEVTNDNIWDATCGNDHVIDGTNTYLNLNGLDRWLEQSLVSLGAANGAKIQSRTKSLLGKEVYNQLAASGRNPAATVLFATATPLKEQPKMDLTELVKQWTDTKVLVATKDAEILALQNQLKEAKLAADKISALEAEVTALKAGDVVKLKIERDSSYTFMKGEATRLALALGQPAPAENTDIATLTASIETNRRAMADRFPVGGATTKVAEKSAPHLGSFKSVR